MTDILSLDNNGIYREISLVENYIWLNKIDREGQMQEKIQILIFVIHQTSLCYFWYIISLAKEGRLQVTVSVNNIFIQQDIYVTIILAKEINLAYADQCLALVEGWTCKGEMRANGYIQLVQYFSWCLFGRGNSCKPYLKM